MGGAPPVGGAGGGILAGCKKGKVFLGDSSEHRHLSLAHASAVRGPTPLGWLASWADQREREKGEGEKNVEDKEEADKW